MSRSHPDNLVQKRQRRARLLHSVYTWHRWLGLSVLLWALTWAVTGLLIEASPTLGLDRKTVSANWLMKRYGIAEPQAIQQWQAGPHLIAEWDQGISLNGEWLDTSLESQMSKTALQGVVLHNDMLILATTQQVALFSTNGEAIDQFPAPVEVQQLGTRNGTVVLKSGDQNYQSEDDLIEWLPTSMQASWSTAQPIELKQSSIDKPKALHDISYERVVLDIHSGTLFGPVGRWLSRLAAVVMIFLGLTGFYTWFTRFARKP